MHTDIVSNERKTELEKQLAETILANFEKGALSYEEMKKSSAYILDGLKDVIEEKQLAYFFENLAAHWPIFKDIRVLYSEKGDKAMEEKKQQALRDAIKNSQNTH
ncbi:MAG TPA: hypothetical protein VJH96_04100 [Patescibacteria group bacterium]|nr:hypothetical protein [Patescibacteria group bacterium]